MRLTLTQIQDHVIQKIENTGEGSIPKSWHRKVSSPTTSHERSRVQYPGIALNRIFNVRGSPLKFQESAREPHPFSSELMLNPNLTSRDAYFQSKRTLTARRAPP